MRLVAASFQPDELDGSPASPRIESLVPILAPIIGIEFAAGLKAGGQVGAANNLSGGQAGDGWNFASPVVRSLH